MKPGRGHQDQNFHENRRFFIRMGSDPGNLERPGFAVPRRKKKCRGSSKEGFEIAPWKRTESVATKEH